MMDEYHVTWEIDLAADSYKDAALKALGLMQVPTSAVVFSVTKQHYVDGERAWTEDADTKRIDLQYVEAI